MEATKTLIDLYHAAEDTGMGPQIPIGRAREVLGEDCESYLSVFQSTGMITEKYGFYRFTDNAMALLKYQI